MSVLVLAIWQAIRLELPVSRPHSAFSAPFRSFLTQSEKANRPLRQASRPVAWGGRQDFYVETRSPLISTRFIHVTSHLKGRTSSLPRSIKAQPVTPYAEAANWDIIPQLSQQRINALFGEKVGRKEGNTLLKTLQKHRGNGTLDHKVEKPERLVVKALAYLRSRYPVDEDGAIIARVDREFQDQFRLPQEFPERSPYAISQLEEMRKENQKRYALEKKRREVATSSARGLVRNRSEQTLEIKERSFKNLLQHRGETPAWVVKYRERATMQEIPELTVFARLISPGLVMLTAVALSLLFAHNYIPPSQSARLFPETPPAAASMFSLIGVNIAVFVLWRLPPMWAFMNRTFILTAVYPRAAAVIGSGFSHQEFLHLLGNSFVLFLIGTRLHDDIGRGPLLALVFASGAIASFTSMASYVLCKRFDMAMLGASNIICAMIAASCVLREGRTVVFPIIPPDLTRMVDTGFLLLILMARDVLGLRKRGIVTNVKNKSTTDHIGHLAGYVTGIAAGCLIRSNDSRWHNLERRHFWNRPGRQKDDVSESFTNADEIEAPR